MLNALADIADRYTEDPESKPEVVVYHYVNRLVGRAVRAARCAHAGSCQLSDGWPRTGGDI